MVASAVAEFEEVTKTYSTGLFGREKLCALAGVSLQVQPGEVLGLLGPNRAGKTTLVKILLSLCRPTSGTITRLGEPVSSRRTLTRVGYVHENQAFPRYLTARALLEYYGALSLISEPEVRQRVPLLLERVGLADRSNEPIARFSKGMVQRLGLAQALLNDPELLVLDEPTEGLDLLGRQMLRLVVQERKSQGGTVILVSHVLNEIEQLCDRVAVLVGGQLAHIGPLSSLIGSPQATMRRSLEQALQDLYGKARS